MVHAAGDAGWVAWTNGVDASVAGRTTPVDVDTKIATQHTADDSTYATPASAGADATVLVAALAAVTPTIEDLIVAVPVRDFTATSSNPILVAPFPLQIISASLIVWSNGVVASDTNWWEFRINKQTASVPDTQIATKNTKVTGGTAITMRVDWNFDTVSWDATAATLAKGDALKIAGYVTGSPAAVIQPLVTVRYRPL